MAAVLTDIVKDRDEATAVDASRLAGCFAGFFSPSEAAGSLQESQLQTSTVACGGGRVRCVKSADLRFEIV